VRATDHGSEDLSARHCSLDQLVSMKEKRSFSSHSCCLCTALLSTDLKLTFTTRWHVVLTCRQYRFPLHLLLLLLFICYLCFLFMCLFLDFSVATSHCLSMFWCSDLCDPLYFKSFLLVTPTFWHPYHKPMDSHLRKYCPRVLSFLV
jgi:hypothetical protein